MSWDIHLPRLNPRTRPEAGGPRPIISVRQSGVDAHIAKNVQELRRTTGMTQAELGVLTGLGTQGIQKLESGNNRILSSTLFLIANVFRVEVDQLIPVIKIDFERFDNRSKVEEFMKIVFCIDNPDLVTSLNQMARSIARGPECSRGNTRPICI
ncbi:helix-turn-helix transcriptional regulator [Roseomonas sp. JC162]|uniref:Helix-turn-helix transcriptional regulator n=1 Tax=Neoroseomonas marina TaxID=1232220 RepID=A0A848EEP2_9PROT|nr:helix-turn-helix transcriptional regulator [Neoroseomonas marina]